MGGHSGTGIKEFSIGGRMRHVRQRCLGMTDEERRWRAQFLKDQILPHGEPREVPEYYKATTNPIRRLWKGPMAILEKRLISAMGEELGRTTRQVIGKGIFAIAALYVMAYQFKYCTNDWTRSKGLTYGIGNEGQHPSDPNFPNLYKKSPQEYYDNGFSTSPLAKKVEKPIPPPPVVYIDETKCPKP